MSNAELRQADSVIVEADTCVCLLLSVPVLSWSSAVVLIPSPVV